MQLLSYLAIFFSSNHSVTYPSKSDQNTTVGEHTLLLDNRSYNLSESRVHADYIEFPFKLWSGFPTGMDLNIIFNAVANVTLYYGAGVFYQPQLVLMPYTFALVPGFLSMYGRHFFF